MKVVRSIITIITIVLSLVACGKKEPKEPKQPEVVNFPHEMTIVDSQGRSIEVTLIGRSREIVIFKKKNSTQVFEYPIADLSTKSKIFITSLPVTKTKEEDPYISLRKKEIEKLEKEIRDLRYELVEARGDSARTRGIDNSIRRIELKILKEQQDIDDYLFDQKQ